jgi:N-acetylmuramoyl-L-alanine amidase
LKSKKIPLIVIDPGHGGEEEGAHGVRGVLEKNVVLDISKKMDTLLRNELGVRTFLTRTTDVDIPLEERTKIANDMNADLFISIHANASLTKRASGIETYYLDNTDDRSSLKLAKRENTTKRGGGLDDLSFIISDLIQNAKLDESISLAHHIQNSLYTVLSREYEGVKDLGVKKAPFYVLVGAHMPCVLVEVSFIDHPKEGQLLTTSRYQKVIAWALVDGVRSFLESR